MVSTADRVSDLPDECVASVGDRRPTRHVADYVRAQSETDDIQEPTEVGARLVPEGPHVALEEATGLMEHMTPQTLAELAERSLRRISDEAAQVVIFNRLCRAEPDTWAVVAEQLTQLLVQRHDSAIDSLEEAEALERDAAVIRCNALDARRQAEAAALTLLRAFPPKLAAQLFGDALRGEQC